jgi:hypothetical protein
MAYATLDFTVIPGRPHALPVKYRKYLPTFEGDDAITTKPQLEKITIYLEDACVEHEDRKMKLLAHSLQGVARIWFKSLPNAGIPTFAALEDAFRIEWGDMDYRSFLAKFKDIKKNEDEIVG